MIDRDTLHDTYLDIAFLKGALHEGAVLAQHACMMDAQPIGKQLHDFPAGSDTLGPASVLGAPLCHPRHTL